MQEVHYWQEMTSGEVTQLFSNQHTNPCFIFFPVGVIEAHGPLMPLGFDVKIVRLMTHIVCENVIGMFAEKGIRPVIFDSIADLGVISSTYNLDGGIPYEGMDTTKLLFTTIQSLYSRGIKHFFMINGDGGTSKSLRALLFRSERERTQFFGSWKGSFNFMTWFDDAKHKIDHAGPHEHAVLKYVCDLADDHTHTLAAKFRLHARLLTKENLAKLERFQPKRYSQPHTEIVSWTQIPGQVESGGVSYFSLDEYNSILEKGEVEFLWKQQLEKVSRYVCDRITQICAKEVM